MLVAALRSRRGASAALIGLVADGIVRPLISVPLFLEYEAVLKRPERRANTNMTEADVDAFLAAFAAASEAVEVHFLWRPQTPDPGDDLVLEAAINGIADRLVTFNIRDLAISSVRFGRDVCTPAQALGRIRA